MEPTQLLETTQAVEATQSSFLEFIPKMIPNITDDTIEKLKDVYKKAHPRA